jgi:hypothetical protein
MSSTRTSPSTIAEHESPITVRHALAEDLKGVVEVLLAGSLPNTDVCFELGCILQQLRVVASRVQRSVDLATASATLSSNYTVEELEAASSLTRERVRLAVVDIKSAEVRNAEVEKALHTQRKAVGQSARSSTFRFFTGRVQPQPSTESPQQATADVGQRAVDAIPNVGGGRKHANEGIAALTHAAERKEEAAFTLITRPLEFDPCALNVAYAAGLSMLCVLVFFPHCTPPAWWDSSMVWRQLWMERP